MTDDDAARSMRAHQAAREAVAYALTWVAATAGGLLLYVAARYWGML